MAQTPKGPALRLLQSRVASCCSSDPPAAKRASWHNRGRISIPGENGCAHETARHTVCRKVSMTLALNRQGRGLYRFAEKQVRNNPVPPDSVQGGKSW